MKPSIRITLSTMLAVLLFTGFTGACQNSDAKPEEHEFTGSSTNRSVDEALGDALKQLDQAMADQGISDNMASWKMIEVTGQIGGIAGLNELRVKISATFITAPVN